MVQGLGMILFLTMLQASIPLAMRKMISEVTVRQSVLFLTVCVLIYCAVLLLYNVIDVIWMKYLDRLGGKILLEVREKLYAAISRGDYEELLSVGKEKIKNKRDLQKQLGLVENDKKMMIGIVSRLTDQKGMDLVAYIMDEMCSTDDVQLVVLGTGEERYENMFRHFDWKYHGKVSANIYYSEELSHRIYASCDAFLMPSLFEPCGLSQLMSLRYGTVPIVRETGGLKDTVQPYNEYEGTGTGFSFTNYNAREMLNTIRYSEQIYYDRKRDWNKIVERAMAVDFSWAASALKYQEMYDWMIG